MAILKDDPSLKYIKEKILTMMKGA